ncbi:MAG: hypothetical protein ACK55U_00040, partial [Bacteroidota bacterium]
QANAKLTQRVPQLQLWLAARPAEENWKAHFQFLASLVDLVKEEPDEFKAEKILSAPPGMPIGMEADESCNFQYLKR